MNKIPVTLILIFLLYSCTSNDKRAELEKLKKQHADLTAQITALEKELAGTDSGTVKKKLVETRVLAPEAYAHFIEIQGKIESDQNIIITPTAAGVIKSVYAREGDIVKPGQVLAEIDDQVLRQGIEELKTGLDLANQLYEKQENLWKQNIGSEVQYLQIKNQKESLEKKMKTLMEQLELYKIKSSIYGTVDEVMVKTGQSAAPGVPSFHIVNNNQLKVKADVAERFSKSVKEGSPVVVFMNDLNKEISGTISYKGKSINVLNRTFSIIINLNGSDEILPNMSAIVRIKDYENTNAIVVPVNVVQNSDEGTYIFVVKNNGGNKTAYKQPVVTGTVYNGRTEITSGLNSGDEVIMTGLDDIINGMNISTNN